MIKFPKVNKVAGTGLTKLEKVKKVVLAAALGMGLGIVGTSASDAAVPSEPAVLSQTVARANRGALLLAPSVINGNQQMAQHYSHYSHSSHQSHHSHYSSRY